MNKREMVERALGHLFRSLPLGAEGPTYDLGGFFKALAEQAIVVPVKIKQQRFIDSSPTKSKVYYSIGYKAWRYCFGVTGEYPPGKALAIILPLGEEGKDGE